MKKALLLVPLLLLSGCRKELPEANLQTLADLMITDLKAHPTQHCVRTGLLSFVRDGSTWLTYTTLYNMEANVVDDEFKNKLLTLQQFKWLEIKRYASASGESWKVYYTPEARARFGIKERYPVRVDQVQKLCFGPQELDLMEKLGPTETLNGVQRQLVSYTLKPAKLPEWAKHRELDSLVWASYPESKQTGTARYYIEKGVWKLDPTWNPPGTVVVP